VQVRLSGELAITDQLMPVRSEIKLHNCHRNSFLVASRIEGVKVVQGYAHIDEALLQTEHSWNLFKGQHFDLTAEVLGLTFAAYTKIIQLSVYEYLNILLIEEADAWFVPQYHRGDHRNVDKAMKKVMEVERKMNS